ncbi:MAG: 4-(cytidine 5'-diphospho)-2-C-methyl-D-erythritol kinase [Candidatus Cryptobacteroides sp.]
MITSPNVKINLGLHVLRKREDGFHDLDTLFVPYHDISDTLEIVLHKEESVTLPRLCMEYGLPSDYSSRYLPFVKSEGGKADVFIAGKAGIDWNPASDLCAKAYGLLDADFGLPPVTIILEKKSPVGAGLGGGSSDAAFCLMMLNSMFCLGMDKPALADYASKLGSDCAFFIYNTPMRGQGRGEILTPFPLDLEGYELKVVVPEGISVRTAEAYRGIVPSIPEESLPDVLQLPVEQWKNKLVNDFEKTVFLSHPELAAIKQSLYDSGAVYASMSGSGSALFAIYHKDS